MKTFKTAIDWWYYLLILVLAGVVGSRLFTALEISSFQHQIILTGVTIVVIGFPVLLIFTTDYSVDSETLRIRAGPFRWRIKLSEIEKVEPSNSPLSSPALSLKRLKITYSGGRTILVSPQDRSGFQEAIGVHA